MRFPLLLIIPSILLAISGKAQETMLTDTLHHLRKGLQREWSEFPLQPSRDNLTLYFKSGQKESITLSLYQYDVKQDWSVTLNNRHLGNLVADEKLMRIYFEIPAGWLTNNNKLVITPARQYQSNEETDDIRVGRIAILPKPLPDLLHESSVEIIVSEKETGLPLPAKITVCDTRGALQSLDINKGKFVTARNGTVYTTTGKAVLHLPAGEYKIYAGRGFEYGIDSATVLLKPGLKLKRALRIAHEVPLPGWVSSDTHIHTLTHSGHGDASFTERAITIAGEGIELPVITEHNKQVSIDTIAKDLQLEKYFTSITGNEVTTAVGHFNVFPLAPDTPVPDFRVKDWNSISNVFHSIRSPKVIILNHARDIHNRFRPFDPKRHISVAGLNLLTEPFPANAMEVINSGSQQTDIMQLFHDWFGMLNGGHKVTPVGSSDSHDVIRYTVGQARTYIRSSTDDPGKIDKSEVIQNLLDGKVMVSFGLLVTMRVNEQYLPGDIVPARGKVKVQVEVLGPRWLQADRVSLYANGIKIREQHISASVNKIVKWKGEWLLDKPAHDIFLVAIADGPGKYLPHWPIAKPYQPASGHWKPTLIAATGAIQVDANGGRSFSSARELAADVIAGVDDDPGRLMHALNGFDAAVAAQCAALLHLKGFDFRSPSFIAALKNASASVRSGFNKFLEAYEASRH